MAVVAGVFGDHVDDDSAQRDGLPGRGMRAGLVQRGRGRDYRSGSVALGVPYRERLGDVAVEESKSWSGSSSE